MIKQLSIQCFLSFNFLNINLCMFKHDELEERFRHSRHDSAERNKSRGLEVRVLVLGNLEVRVLVLVNLEVRVLVLGNLEVRVLVLGNLEVRLIVLEVRISIWVLVLGNLDFGKLEFRAFGNLVLGNLNLKSEVKLNV